MCAHLECMPISMGTHVYWHLFTRVPMWARISLHDHLLVADPFVPAPVQQHIHSHAKPFACKAIHVHIQWPPRAHMHSCAHYSPAFARAFISCPIVRVCTLCACNRSSHNKPRVPLFVRPSFANIRADIRSSCTHLCALHFARDCVLLHTNSCVQSLVCTSPPRIRADIHLS